MKMLICCFFAVLFLFFYSFHLSYDQIIKKASGKSLEALSKTEKCKIKRAFTCLEIAGGSEVSLFTAKPVLINPNNFNVYDKPYSIASIEPFENSLMIGELTNAMSEEEFVDLISYQETLEKAND